MWFGYQGVGSLRFRLDVRCLLKSPCRIYGLLVFNSHPPSKFKSLVRFCRHVTVNLNSQYSYCREDRFQSMSSSAKARCGSLQPTLAKLIENIWFFSPICTFSANIAIVEVALTPLWDHAAASSYWCERVSLSRFNSDIG